MAGPVERRRVGGRPKRFESAIMPKYAEIKNNLETCYIVSNVAVFGLRTT